MGLPMSNIHTPTLPSRASDPSSSPPATLQDLIKRKDNVEEELKALGSVLDSHNVDMQTPLLTRDGFPRADIDVAQIRNTRTHIIRLRNDHARLMADIEPLLHAHFAAVAAPAAPAPTASTAAAAALTSDGAATNGTREVGTPFARVNTVEDASPAAQAGLAAGDRVVAFGDAEWLNHEKLGRVARIVAASEGRAVPVSVLRGGRVIVLSLTPRRGWGGRGLLGCHLVPE